MKPLQLKEKQQIQLVEMIKFFYPEYEFVWIKNDHVRMVQDKFKHKKPKEVCIHWFEFVLITLISKLLKDYEKIEECIEGTDCVTWENLSYNFNFNVKESFNKLYKIFKKLKK